MFEEIEDILTLPDIQYLLGIGKNTALKLIHSGELPAFRVGKQWRVRKTDLISFTKVRKN
ncbi:MAG: helix-turn-helix domain-containing protein [Lachnospiraceae bacterium]|nr:helix-turn-helix domain-containing protein [Lachnospiraceae bacterium]